MQKQTTNIFEREVSWFNSFKETKPGGNAPIRQLLKRDRSKDKIQTYRKTKNSEIKLSLPCFTPSGIFSVRKEKGLVQHSGLICIDVDAKDNEDVENFADVKKLICKIPYVAYCGLSCSGEGYFILIPIEQPDKHKEHFKAIANDFKNSGIAIDEACKDVSRLRFISYDADAYFCYEAVVYTRLIEEENEKKEQTPATSSIDRHYGGDNNEKSKYTIEKIIDEISKRKLDISGSYKQWFEIGAALANEFGEDGREYYHEISRYYSKYSREETNRQYSDCLKTNKISIGTFFYYVGKYQIQY